MSKKKTRQSTCAVVKNEKVIAYITKRDEEKGLDICLNQRGYEIIAL